MEHAKSSYYSAYPTSAGRSFSPPEIADSASTSAMHSRAPSYSNSVSSSSYAGSASDEYSSIRTAPRAGASSGVDLAALLTDRLESAFDPIPLDRSLASQAKTSGALNAKTRELLELQAQAQRRLAGTRANFAEGMRAAREVKGDLEWVQKRVTALNARTERNYPVEYNMARDRYPVSSEY
jgi:hypothetical protein